MDRRVVPRLCLGHAAWVVEGDEGVELEADIRACPGREVDVVFTAPAGSRPPPPRRAIVWSWRFVGAGPDGPRYHGYCRWLQRASTTGGADAGGAE